MSSMRLRRSASVSSVYMKKRTITEENEQDVDVNKINLEEGSSWDKNFSELKNEIIQLNKKITSTQQKHKKKDKHTKEKNH